MITKRKENNLHVPMQSLSNSNYIHHKDLKINPKVHLEAQKAVNSQSNTEQREQCWRYHNI
jgi:hypothetical protein